LGVKYIVPNGITTMAITRVFRVRIKAELREEFGEKIADILV